MNIHTRTAAVVFNTPEEQVTPAMLARARTINSALVFRQLAEPTPANDIPRHQVAYQHKTLDVGASIHTLVYGASPEPGWKDCPNCKQSATGAYHKVAGCARCGWPWTRVRRSL